MEGLAAVPSGASAASSHMSNYKLSKLEMEAMKNWDKFYKRNSRNFFKDRHWTREEFKMLCKDIDWDTDPKFDQKRCQAFVCDLTIDCNLSYHIPADSLDFCTLVFVLSAIHPDKIHTVLSNISQVMKPGGSVIFRDYAVNDHAMLRFDKRQRLMENFFVRQDGTRAYFFSTDDVTKAFENSGFSTDSISYIKKQTVNVKEKIDVPRVFVQGRFIKL